MDWKLRLLTLALHAGPFAVAAGLWWLIRRERHNGTSHVVTEWDWQSYEAKDR